MFRVQVPNSHILGVFRVQVCDKHILAPKTIIPKPQVLDYWVLGPSGNPMIHDYLPDRAVVQQLVSHYRV